MNDRITVKQASEMLEVSIPQVRYWIRKGILPGRFLKRDGGKAGTYLIYREQVEEFKRDKS